MRSGPVQPMTPPQARTAPSIGTPSPLDIGGGIPHHTQEEAPASPRPCGVRRRPLFKRPNLSTMVMTKVWPPCKARRTSSNPICPVLSPLALPWTQFIVQYANDEHTCATTSPLGNDHYRALWRYSVGYLTDSQAPTLTSKAVATCFYPRTGSVCPSRQPGKGG